MNGRRTSVVPSRIIFVLKATVKINVDRHYFLRWSVHHGIIINWLTSAFMQFAIEFLNFFLNWTTDRIIPMKQNVKIGNVIKFILDVIVFGIVRMEKMKSVVRRQPSVPGRLFSLFRHWIWRSSVYWANEWAITVSIVLELSMKTRFADMMVLEYLFIPDFFALMIRDASLLQISVGHNDGPFRDDEIFCNGRRHISVLSDKLSQTVVDDHLCHLTDLTLGSFSFHTLPFYPPLQKRNFPSVNEQVSATESFIERDPKPDPRYESSAVVSWWHIGFSSIEFRWFSHTLLLSALFLRRLMSISASTSQCDASCHLGQEIWHPVIAYPFTRRCRPSWRRTSSLSPS